MPEQQMLLDGVTQADAVGTAVLGALAAPGQPVVLYLLSPNSMA